MPELTDFSTLTFDCYGTLIDWESGIWDALQPLITASGRSDITRHVALTSHAELESRQEAATPSMLYPHILEYVHRGFADRFDLRTNDEMTRAFGASVAEWPAFPDSADALRSLKDDFKLVILSNIDQVSFAASNRKLGVEFDAIYTAEDIGSYKPDASNFDFMLERIGVDLGVEKHEILHTAQSLFHDHVPARRHGLANAWIDRQGLNQGGEWGATAVVKERPEFDFIFPTMKSLADAVRP